MLSDSKLRRQIAPVVLFASLFAGCRDATFEGIEESEPLAASAQVDLRTPRDFPGVDIDVPAILPAHFTDDDSLIAGIRAGGGGGTRRI